MALIGQTDEWLMGEGWLDRERSLIREEPLSPSPHGFPDAHPVCASLASITSSTEQGLASAGRMESVRFLAVGEMGAVDLFSMLHIAGLKELSHFLIQDSQSLCQDEGITQVSSWKQSASGWESHFPKAEHLENVGRIPTQILPTPGSPISKSAFLSLDHVLPL